METTTTFGYFERWGQDYFFVEGKSRTLGYGSYDTITTIYPNKKLH